MGNDGIFQADPLNQTTAYRVFARLFKELIFNRATSGIYNKYIHVCIFDFIKGIRREASRYEYPIKRTGFRVLLF